MGIRKTRNTDDSLGSGTKLLLPSLSLGFSTRGERETQFFYADCSSVLSSQLTDPTNARAHSAVHTALASPRSEKSAQFKSQLLLLFEITKNPRPSLLGMTSFTSPGLGFLSWHLWLSHPPCVRVNTCVNVCTYPCTKPKSSKPN